MNVLEPLYEACISRMHDFVAEDDERSGRKYPQFRGVLDEIRNHTNLRYYIYKSIILNNLYGVDIMNEAVEIAKLRLFLKLMAEVEHIDDVEPMPDIDYNIRVGNTLVGFATYRDVEKAVTSSLDFGGDSEQIREEAEKVGMAFKRFKDAQLIEDQGTSRFRQAKSELRQKLATLNDKLNVYLARQYGIDHPAQDKKTYQSWKSSHQPFHWFAEFYEIVYENGGFDAVIGNPPYVVYTKKNRETKKSIAEIYQLRNYRTLSSNNLYAFLFERAMQIARSPSGIGFIIPISSISSGKFEQLQNIFHQELVVWYSSYSNRPAKLFGDVEQRLCIIISQIRKEKKTAIFSTSYKHWYSETRNYLFETLNYTANEKIANEISLSKIGNCLEYSIKIKLFSKERKLGAYCSQSQINSICYHDGPTYWIRAMSFEPNNGKDMQQSSHYHSLSFDKSLKHTPSSILNSSIFYFFFKNYSNCRDFSEREIFSFPVGEFDESTLNKLTLLEKALEGNYKTNRERRSRNYESGLVYYEEYYPQKCKPIIDEIDKVLAKHYGFTEEELDFIINYDIKYRMGKEL